MSQAAALLDTDILSELLKQHPQVTHRIRLYLAEHGRLTFSIITPGTKSCAVSELSKLERKRPPLTRCVRAVSFSP